VCRSNCSDKGISTVERGELRPAKLCDAAVIVGEQHVRFGRYFSPSENGALLIRRADSLIHSTVESGATEIRASARADARGRVSRWI